MIHWETFFYLWAAIALGFLLHSLLFRLLRKRLSADPSMAAQSLSQPGPVLPPDVSLYRKAKAPALFVVLTLSLLAALPLLALDVDTRSSAQPWLIRLLIATTTWLLLRSTAALDDLILDRHQINVSDNLSARRVHTQVSVLSRVVMLLILIVGICAIFMTFPRVRTLGAGLMTSAGVIGLILGLAAKPTLGNLIAGIQLALTQPIRLDDVVIVEEEWGWIEEITLTYVVVRIWDQRRLIVPLQHFIEQPFQNWTRTNADILGTVTIETDYTVPVEEIRKQLRIIAEQSPHWDQRVCVLHVTEAGRQTVQLRALVSSANSPDAWELRCFVREKLIAYLQDNYPHALPSLRLQNQSAGKPD